jgi:hypothetical protein
MQVARLEKEKEALEQKLMSRTVKEPGPSSDFRRSVLPSAQEYQEAEPEGVAEPLTFEPSLRDMPWKAKTKRPNNFAPPISQLRKAPRLENSHPIVSKWAQNKGKLIVGSRKGGID